MADSQENFSFIKEMLISFFVGGSLGLIVLVGAEVVVALLKK